MLNPCVIYKSTTKSESKRFARLPIRGKQAVEWIGRRAGTAETQIIAHSPVYADIVLYHVYAWSVSVCICKTGGMDRGESRTARRSI